MILRLIDCKTFTDKISAHNEIKKAMEFPSYYGSNLDALWDMLTQLTSETLVILLDASYAHEETSGITDTFTQAGEENRNLRVVII